MIPRLHKEIMQHCNQYDNIHFKIRIRLDDWNRKDIINLQTLRKWGIDEIQYGAESPQNDILSLFQKGMSFERNTIVKLFKKHYEKKILYTTQNSVIIVNVSSKICNSSCFKIIELSVKYISYLI